MDLVETPADRFVQNIGDDDEYRRGYDRLRLDYECGYRSECVLRMSMDPPDRSFHLATFFYYRV